MTQTALIIGAGPAGLAAATELLKRTDIHPIIVEQNDFIGGISATRTYKGNRLDMGGHRFFSKSEKVCRWWTEVMPLQGSPSADDLLFNRRVDLSETGPDPETNDLVMLNRNRVSRIYYLQSFFDYPVSLNMQTIRNLGFMKMMKIGFSYLKSVIHKRPEISLEDFFINRFGQELYETFFRDYTEKLWGVKCSDIAADWGAQRVKGLSVFKVLLNFAGKALPFLNRHKETSLIESFWYPKLGPGQLWEEIARRVEQAGGEVRLNTRVVKINTQGNTAVSVVVDGPNGTQTIPADYVLSSMPICDLTAALPDVPDNVKTVSQGLAYRDFRTVGLLLNKMKLGYTLHESILNGMSKDTWIYVQEKGVKLGRVQIFNNWSPYLVHDFKNTVWIGLEYFCREGDDLWNMSDSDFTAMAVQEAVSIGLIDAKDVLDTVNFKVPKAYPAYFGTYNRFDEVKTWLNEFSNLFVMGRNGMHHYNNMDHSVLTAMAVVDYICGTGTDKQEIWNVNTEKSYHEDK